MVPRKSVPVFVQPDELINRYVSGKRCKWNMHAVLPRLSPGAVGLKYIIKCTTKLFFPYYKCLFLPFLEKRKGHVLPECFYP